MANALDNLLKGAGDIAGGLYKGLKDWGINYTYGPYAGDIANARLESERARKAYWERSQGNDETKNLATLLEALNEAEIMGDWTPEQLAEITRAKQQVIMAMSKGIGGTQPANQNSLGDIVGPPKPEGYVSPKVAPATQSNAWYKPWTWGGENLETLPEKRQQTKEKINRFMTHSGFPKSTQFNFGAMGATARPNAGGALSNINGIDSTAIGVQQTQVAKPSKQPETFSVTSEIDFYMPKLNQASRASLQQVIQGGDQNAINQALQRLRDKYGPVR